MENNYTNGWNEYKKLVLYQLETLNDKTDNINNKLDKLSNDFLVVKTKVGVVGGLVALIVTLSVNILLFFLSHGKL